LAAGPAAGEPSNADQERAKQHFLSGRDHYQNGRLRQALEDFQESYRLSGKADLLFNLALVSEQMGAYPRAIAYLEEYLRQVPDAPDGGEVRGRIAALRDKQRQLDPPPAPPPAPPPPVPPPAAPPPAKPAARWPPAPALALLGGGAALLAVGAGLGGAALTASRSDEEHRGAFDPGAEARGLALERAGVALDVIGAAALVAGTIWTVVWHVRRGQEPRSGVVPRSNALILNRRF
jgi:tetratricopeptide (TPR) repeat protein